MYFIKEFDIIHLNNETKIIINFLSGAADLLDEKTFSQIINGDFINMDAMVISALRERHYIFDSKYDYNEFVNSLNTKLLLEESKQSPNFLLIPTYNCNLNCSYCYEKGYEIDGEDQNSLTNYELALKMFNAIESICNKTTLSFQKEDINITLMGGEPLYKQNVDLMSHIFSFLKEKKYKVSIITNGYDLDFFIEDIKKLNLDFVQITLDGTKDIHDTKRYDLNGDGTYEKILNNIQIALSNGIDVYIRTNVDYDNIENLPQLARILEKLKAIHRNLYPYIYILQDGGCAGNKKIVNEIDSLRKIFKLEEDYPEMKIYQKTFHGLRFIESIFENKQYEARLSNCAACKNQYILDKQGRIFKCWFGVGNDSFKIGNYIPELDINQNLENAWRNRNIINLEKCRNCNYRYICGGGCASRTKVNSISGIREERCADFLELFNMYFQKTLCKTMEI